MNWDKSDLVQFIDDRAYAIDLKGQTWDIGSEAEIRDILHTGKINIPLQGAKLEALQIVLDYYEEAYGYGDKSETKRVGDFRSRPARNFEHRAKTSRRSAPEKRIPLRQTKQPE